MCNSKRTSRSTRALLASLLALFWLPQAALAFDVYLSPDGAAPGAPADIPIGSGPVTLDLWVTNGTAPASAEPCAGTQAGSELCMWDLHLATDSEDIQILAFTADPAAGAVVNQQPDSVRVNGGNPLQGTLGPQRVGSVEVEAFGSGELLVMGGAWVDNQLQAQPVPASQLLGATCADGDGDTLCDASDACPSYANAPGAPDSNSDGIPDDCQCGDTDDTGFINFSDALNLSNCASGSNCIADVDLADADGNGVFQFADAFAVAQVASGTKQPWELTCPRRPEGTQP